jgi:hypothetical protein
MQHLLYVVITYIPVKFDIPSHKASLTIAIKQTSEKRIRSVVKINKILLQKSEGKRCHWWPRCKRVENTEVWVKEIQCKIVV